MKSSLKIYSTGSIQNIDEIVTDIFERSKTILAKDSPFDVEANIPHIANLGNEV